MSYHLLLFLQLLFVASLAFAASWTASPFIPPSLPLAVKTPYLQTWMHQGAADGSLNSGWESFRDGTIIAWLGILRVDSKSYVWMGDPQGKNAAIQKDMEFTATRTTITMTCGTVDLTATFLSPIEPTDLVNQSIPFSYLSVNVISNDGNPHQVQLYTDVTGEWLVSGSLQPQSDQLFQWATTTGTVLTHQFSLQNQTQYLERDGRVRYGTMMYSTPQVNGSSYQVGQDTLLRPGFITSGVLNNTVDSQFRAISSDWPVFAFAHDLGVVGTTAATNPVVYAIGYVRDPLVQISNVPNINSLRGSYYLTRYSSNTDLVAALLNDYPNTLARATNFDTNLTQAAFEVTPQDANYGDIIALSARQIFGNIEITAGWDGAAYVPTDIMAFMRDGATNTVDIIYSAWPAFLYTNPAIGRYLLEPVLAYQAANPVQGGYAIRDIGASLYPIVTGPSNTSLPVEESGNQLIMALSYTQRTSDNSLIMKYQSLYDQFAAYLVQNGLYIADQRSSDNFAGSLANQTNLAVKSIIALRAAGEIFNILGESDKSQTYNDASATFLDEWQKIALSSDKSHYTLSYGDNPSWGLLYNLYADQLLGFNMFPESVYETQTSWYARELSDFGIQLDSRSSDAKTDWQLWTAATLTDQTLRTKMITLVHKYASSRLNNRPFPDRYNSTNGQMATYNDRTVVGGHFALLLTPPLVGSTNGSNGNSGNGNETSGSDNSGRLTASSLALPMVLAWLVTLISALL